MTKTKITAFIFRQYLFFDSSNLRPVLVVHGINVFWFCPNMVFCFFPKKHKKIHSTSTRTYVYTINTVTLKARGIGPKWAGYMLMPAVKTKREQGHTGHYVLLLFIVSGGCGGVGQGSCFVCFLIVLHFLVMFCKSNTVSCVVLCV